MRRSVQYPGSLNRGFDAAAGFQDVEKAIGQALTAVLGQSNPVIQGLTVTQGSGFNLNVAAGAVAAQVAQDAGIGSVPADSSLTYAVGTMGASTYTATPPTTSSGQSVIVLLTVRLTQVTGIRTNDPTGGLLPYQNTATPGQPLQGPGGSSTTNQTYVTRAVVIGQVNGAPVSAGQPVAPAVPAGQTLLATLTYTNGSTAYSSIAMSYNLAGLLNSHHAGTPGQAPKILIGVEIPASDALGQISAVQQCAGNPNGQVAGYSLMQGNQPPSMAWDYVNYQMYVCIGAGPAATATWRKIGIGGLLNVQSYLTYGTFRYVPTPGAASVIFMPLLSAGGSGGGCAANASGSGGASAGSGGASGSWRSFRLTQLTAFYTLIVGQGTPGNSNANGTPGGNSSLTDANGTAICTCTGGAAGNVGLSASASGASVSVQANGGGTTLLAASYVQDLGGSPGNYGTSGIAVLGQSMPGYGGSTPWGAGGGNDNTGNGQDSPGYAGGVGAASFGGGGGGAGSQQTQAAAGGHGSNGMAIAMEFA